MMRLLKNGILCVVVMLAIVSAGCLGTRDSYNRFRPRWPVWSLVSDQPDPEHLIRYDCIYVWKPDDIHVPGWRVLRFWKSGHFGVKLVENYLERDSYDSLHRMTIGFYRVEGRQLSTETFVAINGGQYGYGVFRIENNGDITSLSAGFRLSKQSPIPPETFKPIEVDELKLLPDW